jgi:hypothetical protein
MVRISCNGVTAGPLSIPAFRLKVGEFVCLHMPCLSNSKEESLVIRLLTGILPNPSITLYGRVLLAEPAVIRARFMEFFRPIRVGNWLQRKAGISLSEARAIASNLGLDVHDQVCRLSGGPKALLGLEAAWASGADAIVFSTAGYHREPLFNAVLSHIDQCPAVHLSYEYWTQGRLERSCHPQARCIEVTQRPGTGTLREYVESNPHAFGRTTTR